MNYHAWIEQSIDTMRDAAIQHFADGDEEKAWNIINEALEHGISLQICEVCQGQGFVLQGEFDDIHEVKCPFCTYPYEE